MPSWEFLSPTSPSKSLIMSCRVLYDLRHVSHDAPSVCPAVTEGPASSHSCQTAPSLTDCRYLYIKTMLCQSELVCPSPWVEACHYSTHTQREEDIISDITWSAWLLQALKCVGLIGVWLFFWLAEYDVSMRTILKKTYQYLSFS